MLYQMLCAIWNHLYNLKNVINTHVGTSLLVRLQAYFTKSNTPPFFFCFFCFVFFSCFLKLYKWYQIVQRILRKLTPSDKVILDTVLK